MKDQMKRLKIEVKQTMDMYHAACKEALQAKHKVLNNYVYHSHTHRRVYVCMSKLIFSMCT